MTTGFVLLVLAAYLMGALPAAYLAARLCGGIDLRKYGTGQVGSGNLLRMTSWKLGLLVGIFDFGKGALMVWVGSRIGLGLAQQVVIGLATMIGHNWSVFLNFGGGRGVGTAIGLIVVLPLVNSLSPWGTLAFVMVALVTLLITRSTPLPVLTGIMAAPLATWLANQPLALTLGFVAIFLLIVLKRLSLRQPAAVPVSRQRLLLNRLLFDRDIEDRKAWMYRKPAGPEEPTKGPESK